MFRSGTLTSAASGGQTMTVSGAMAKAAFLLVLALVSAGLTWNAVASNPALGMPLLLVGVIGGLVLSLATAFKPQWSPVTAPMYALVEGLFLGVVSLRYGSQFDGIVFQAVVLTVAVAVAMLALYTLGVIRPTERFRAIVFSATLGVALFYLVAMVLQLGFKIEVPLIHSSGMLGIGFSLFVVALAGFNLIIDFGDFEAGEQAGAPRYMEWYCGFALLVTLVWLYIEILRLLSKLRSSD
jgi:uncharacterized YccA/Bax inhibitor family protein